MKDIVKPQLDQSPLDFIIKWAIETNLQAICLCEYDVHENYQTRRRDRFFVSPGLADIKFAEMVADAKQKEMEVGLCSSFIGRDADIHHFYFADFDMKPSTDFNAKGWALAPTSKTETGTHYHGYMKVWYAHFHDVVSHLLPYPVDQKWLKCGLQRGFNVLRLTTNTPRFKEQAPIRFSVVP